MKNFKLFIYAAVISLFFSCGNSSQSVEKIELFPVKNGKEFQYIDREGKIVINPQFRDASIFRDGLALVRSTGDESKWGYISENGNYAIPAKYKEATVFSNDLAWVVSENSAPSAINKKGEIIITLQNADMVRNFKENLAAYSISDTSGMKWGFVDKEGKIKISPQFSMVSDFSDGKCAVENKEGKGGYIDEEGKIVINYQFDRAGDFINGKAIVKSGDKFGVIDDAGKYLINPQFDKMIIDGSDFLFKQDDKWGWCDAEGKITINAQFSKAMPFMGSNLAPVESGDKWGYIDHEGKIVINPQFDYALPYNGNLAIVVSDKKIGFITEEGKFAINPQYDESSNDIADYLMGETNDGGYNMVETDFFNITAITNRVKITNPEGLPLTAQLSDVVKKFNMNEDQFNLYYTEHRVKSNEKITNDAELNFYVYADPATEVPDGWYTRKVFNPSAPIMGYAYEINLGGRGNGKEKVLMNAFEKTFSGYQKEAQSSDDVRIFSNAQYTIRIVYRSSQVILQIYPKVDETNQ